MLVTSQLPIQTTKILYSFQRALVPPHFEKGSATHGSNVSWIKVQSTSKTMYEDFHFSLKLQCARKVVSLAPWPSVLNTGIFVSERMHRCQTSILVNTLKPSRCNNPYIVVLVFNHLIAHAAPQTKLQAHPNWNMKHYKSVEFLSILNVKPAQK